MKLLFFIIGLLVGILLTLVFAIYMGVHLSDLDAMLEREEYERMMAESEEGEYDGD